jgi:copper transport protein
MNARARARACLLAALLAALGAAVPGEATGHAVLVHSTPHRGDAVASAPPRVQFDFSEAVQVNPGGLRVYDAAGERVDKGEVVRGGDSARSVAVSLPDKLGDGVYTATYRVISADGHPVSGGVAFTIGSPAAQTARTAPTVAALLERSEAGPAVEAIYGTARGLHYAALLLLVGAVGVLAVWWPRAGIAARWPRRLLIGAAAVGLLASLVGLSMQGTLGAAVGLHGALSITTLNNALQSRTGAAWLVRAGLWALALCVLTVVRRPRPRAVLLGLVGAALVISLPLAGHANTQSPRAVLLSADLLHVLGAGLWLGGLVVLIALYWPLRREPVDQDAAAATLAFSRLALPAIVVLVIAGALQAWFYLDGLGSFLAGAYGLALLAKIGLLATIIALAAANRRRALQLAERAPAMHTQLRSTMRAEIALAVLVLAATAVVVRSQPPATLAAGPSISELDLGPMRLEMWIEPARSAPNDFHLYFFDRRTGAQIDTVKEVTVRLTKPGDQIPPIKLKIPRKNVAHYELLDQPIGISGSWNLEVTARVSNFDAYTATTQVEIRRP